MPLFVRLSDVIRAFMAIGGALVVSETSSFILNAAAQSQQARPPTAVPDVNTLGPQVGEKVPDFSLPDQHGQTRTLSSVMGPQGLVLVFNRSADW
jgi:hypothetical protein